MTPRRWPSYFTAVLAASVVLLQGAASQTLTSPATCSAAPGRVVDCVKPSDTDLAISRFDDPHYILFNENTGPDVNLLVFLPGTGAKPPGPVPFLKAAADAGYRVISLAYNDIPAINAFCPRQPDPACADNFRRMRIYGDGTAIEEDIDNTSAESIVNRLVKLLQYLEKLEPELKWGGYLENGTLNWNRIAFAGQSQGAGMAAYIAKRHIVARVILFSSPWDFVVRNGNVRTLAPWILLPSKTPPERWFGGYHERENTADLIAKAYAALRIPTENIRIFRLDLPARLHTDNGNNPFHSEGIRNPAYKEQRAFFLGSSP
jgi:predicted esterase